MLSKKFDIRTLRANESSPLRPIDLARYVDNPSGAALVFTFNGSLPEGIECSDVGVLQGTPAKDTAKNAPYPINVTVANEAAAIELETQLWIYPSISADDIERLHKEAFETLAKGGELPESLKAIIDRPVTKEDVFYLLERYATFIVWNADDLRLANQGKVVEMQGVSDKFAIYDFDVCLVAAPTDLFDHTRVLSHAIETAKGMIREAHSREWNVEFGGFDRMAQAAYYEAHKLNTKSEYQMDIRNYQPVAVEGVKDDVPWPEIE